ncbi:hypothetical protein C7C46_30970 [Streptomyces tateyamensis]|uniref:Uncharacterized protein n=1 Tax=Streptomyces tateyamensis TaxID=565073 RepID=A0A2V4NHG8_9ACTN|nr:hypothetical protein C7C46_30970 [Streptomyces tateyamensis]
MITRLHALLRAEHPWCGTGSVRGLLDLLFGPTRRGVGLVLLVDARVRTGLAPMPVLLRFVRVVVQWDSAGPTLRDVLHRFPFIPRPDPVSGSMRLVQSLSVLLIDVVLEAADILGLHVSPFTVEFMQFRPPVRSCPIGRHARASAQKCGG